MGKKLGRPLRAEEPANIGMSVRWTTREHEAIVRAAKTSRTSFAAFIRQIVLEYVGYKGAEKSND